ncbi:ead/Ea22-like family protein [Salmonella enterica]|nr:ead/Ea22-like family protein [Salmonella enterica]
MSNIDKRALREAAEKATKGEWWSDVVETDGEYGEGEDRVSGYHSYAVYVGHESLLDMTNSTAACIHTEWDHDYLMAWDETAKRNAEFIAAANPGTVLALLDELEAKDNRINRLEAIVAVAEQRNALMREWKRALKVPCDLVDDQVPVVIHGMVIRLERLKETEEKLAAAAGKGE